MSYRDPYSGHYAAGASSQYQTNQAAYGVPMQEYSNPHPTQQSYDNVGADPYYQYPTNAQAYRDDRLQDPYRDDYNEADNQAGYNYPPVQRQNTQKSISAVSRKSKPSVSVIPVRKEGSGFEQGEFTPARRDRSAGALRAYRYDHQGNLWTKGGRARCVGRFCFCTIMTTLFLIISIVLALALWVRPPSIKIGQVQTEVVNGSPVQSTDSTSIQVNMAVNISVANPNYFSVDFKKIQAEIFYPIGDTPIGGGKASDIVFKSGSQTNFTFPFMLTYNSTNDPGSKVILDIASKCGVGGQRTNLNVRYKISLGIRILLITISPVVENEFSFPCPLQPADITKFIGGG